MSSKQYFEISQLLYNTLELKTFVQHKVESHLLARYQQGKCDFKHMKKKEFQIS